MKTENIKIKIIQNIIIVYKQYDIDSFVMVTQINHWIRDMSSMQ